MKETPSLSIGRETLVAVTSKVFMAGVGFVGFVVIANALGNVGLGDYRTVIAAATLLSQFPAGLGTAVKKRVSEVDVDPPEFLGAALLVHGGFSLVVLLAFAAFEPWLSAYFGSGALAYGVVAVVAALGLFNITNRLYAGTGHPALSSWLDGVRSTLTLALQVAFLWLGYETAGVVGGLALATLVTAVLSAVAARVGPSSPTVATARRVYSFARWSVPVSFLSRFYSSSDVFVLKWLVGGGGVGYYAAATQVAMPATMFAGSISDAFSVKASGVDSLGESVRRDLENAFSYTGLVALPLFFGALAMPDALTARVFPSLFGDSFAAVPEFVLVGVALYTVFKCYLNPFEAVFEGTDRPAFIFRTLFAVALVHLPLAVAGGWYYGLEGVVAVTAFTEFLRVVVYEFHAARYYGGVVFTRPVAEQVGASVLMFVAVRLALLPVGRPSLVVALAVVGAGAAVYFLALTLVSGHFRHTVRDVSPVPVPLLDLLD